MDVVEWTYREFDGLPHDGERGFFLGYDADQQPYILRWSKWDTGAGWIAISLDDHPTRICQPIVHALVENNVGKITRWASLPLRWSDMGLPPREQRSDKTVADDA